MKRNYSNIQRLSYANRQWNCCQKSEKDHILQVNSNDRSTTIRRMTIYREPHNKETYLRVSNLAKVRDDVEPDAIQGSW